MVKNKFIDNQPEHIKQWMRDHADDPIFPWEPNKGIIELELRKIMLDMLDELKAIHELLGKK